MLGPHRSIDLRDELLAGAPRTWINLERGLFLINRPRRPMAVKSEAH
jgi:hypothetical protein